MKTTWVLATAAAAGLLLTGLGSSWLGAADANAPSVEDIMRKVNKPRTGLHSQVVNALKGASVDWDAVQKETKEYASLADALGKNDPPKGNKASWEKLTKAYSEDAKALNTAAEKKDKPAAGSVLRKLQGACKGCHTAHRET